jgi:hypothetical protein
MDEPDYMRDEIPDQEPAETSPYPTDMHGSRRWWQMDMTTPQS